MDYRIDEIRDSDWESVRSIYLDGIATGQATFETDVPSWELWDSNHLKICRLAARSGDRLIGWAALSPVSRRKCYSGVAEFSVYVHPDFKGRGVGKALLEELIAESEKNGIWTLQGSTFPENEASVKLQESCGFHVLGRRERIACQNGVWRDTVLTERRSSVVGIG